MKNSHVSQQADKRALRQHFRRLRSRVKPSASQHANLQSNLDRLIQDLASPQTQVTLYCAQGTEAPCRPSLERDYFYPRIEGDQIEFWQPAHFEAGPFGIEQPSLKGAQRLNPRAPILVLCPALAIDHDGQRLGSGKGYYDRFFKSHPSAIRVGVVFHTQLSAQSLPRDPWDQPMDWVVSEEIILTTLLFPSQSLANRQQVRSS